MVPHGYWGWWWWAGAGLGLEGQVQLVFVGLCMLFTLV